LKRFPMLRTALLNLGRDFRCFAMLNQIWASIVGPACYSNIEAIHFAEGGVS